MVNLVRLRTILGHVAGAVNPAGQPGPRAASVQSSPQVEFLAPEAAGLSSSRLERADAFIESIVKEGKAPMGVLGILRYGRLVHLSMAGHRDKERELPVTQDTIYRMFSMTKPVVSVALLMLYEQGCLTSFDEPVANYVPCLKDMRVYVSGDSPETLTTRPAKARITFKHLLTHTSGLGYGFVPDVPVLSSMYAQAVDFGPVISAGSGQQFQPWSLKEAVERLSQLPLLCEPGTEWHYSHATDVVGYLVEASRFAALYTVRSQQPNSNSQYGLIDDPTRSQYLQLPSKGLVSGGGGLVSTVPDWVRWTAFLLRRGSTESGVCLLSPKTFDYAALNHLPGGADLEAMGTKATNHPNVVYKKGQGWSLLGFAVLQEQWPPRR